MLFLHSCDLGVHGNLRSSNCVITSRWTLQVVLKPAATVEWRCVQLQLCHYLALDPTGSSQTGRYS
jgi:hypothetical protein